MTLSEKQEQWIEDYQLIEDPQERLSVIVDQAKSVASLEESMCTDERRVAGCVSAVWIHGELEGGLCQFRLAADSAMVRGLVGLLCRFYSGHDPEDVVKTEPAILEALQLSRQVSPTRMNGLASVRRVIRGIARGLLPE